MRPNTMRTRLLLGAGLAGALLFAQGCVFSIGSGNERHEPSKMQLTKSERDEAVVVRDGESLPSFADAEGRRLGKLGPSTTVHEFNELFPEAIYRGSRTIKDLDVVIYEVRDRRLYRYEGSSYGKMHDRPVFFRFIDDKLESWRPGRDTDGPEDWYMN